MMIPCGLKHVGILCVKIEISKEEHYAFCWLSVVICISTVHGVNNIKHTHYVVLLISLLNFNSSFQVTWLKTEVV
jgi:hypothetical protein